MVVNRRSPAERFGAQARKLREQARLSQTELAKKLLTSQTTVSNIEVGKQRPKRDIAVALDAALTSDGALVEAWDTAFKSYEPPEWYRKLPELERTATEIQDYQPLLVPGLLQVEGYARASVQASNRRADPDYVEAKVRERQERQAILRSEGTPAPFLSAVLDETALYRRLGGSAIMKAQLEHLREVSMWPRVEVLVIPSATPEHPGLDGGFRLLRTPEAGTVLYQETRSGGGVVMDQEAVEDHIALLGDLRGVALPPEQSRALVEKARGEIE